MLSLGFKQHSCIMPRANQVYMKRYVLIHYGEIGLKKGNSGYFVEKLRKRIRQMLQAEFKRNFSIHHSLARLIVELPDDFSPGNEEKYVKIIRKIFGIKNFKFVYEAFLKDGVLDIKSLGEQLWDNLPKIVFDPVLSPRTFKVSVKRSMNLPFKSFEIAGELGAFLYEKGLKMKVKLNNPEFVVDLEFFNNRAYFSYERYAGAGGLSANSQGKLVSLISAGIDSPVASYMMMKRGARIIFVHFHGYPYTDKAEMDHVKQLVKILSDYQFATKLYLVPYGQIQKSIATNMEIPAKIRTVLYRRSMVRIAEAIARKERAKGLITGDNFGQVASQTPDNIFAIHDASSIPIMQPLIGFDKEDIIKIAEQIETFEISKLPCKDTCSMFMPKHPELKANIYEVKEYEKKLPIQDWVGKALKDADVISF